MMPKRVAVHRQHSFRNSFASAAGGSLGNMIFWGPLVVFGWVALGRPDASDIIAMIQGCAIGAQHALEIAQSPPVQ